MQKLLNYELLHIIFQNFISCCIICILYHCHSSGTHCFQCRMEIYRQFLKRIWTLQALLEFSWRAGPFQTLQNSEEGNLPFQNRRSCCTMQPKNGILSCLWTPRNNCWHDHDHIHQRAIWLQLYRKIQSHYKNVLLQ